MGTDAPGGQVLLGAGAAVTETGAIAMAVPAATLRVVVHEVDR
jgi:hypothetical protein